MSTSDPDLSPPRSGKTWTLVVAAGFLAIVLVVLGLVLLFPRSSPQSAPPPPPAPAAGSDSSAEGDQTPPTSPPPVRWELYQRVALPYSATAGPRHVDGAVAADYAHNPVGALIAAIQTPIRAGLSPGDSWRTVAQNHIAPGPGREAFINARAQVSDTSGGEQYGQVAGFRFVTYTPDTAVVQFASRFPGYDSLKVTTITMRWIDGDWKIVLQPNGSASPTAQSVPDLTGFVAWGGV